MKLMTMTNFVLDQGLNPLQSDIDAWINTHNYAEFLKKELNLSMFIVCDENEEPLEEPNIDDYHLDENPKGKLNFHNSYEKYKRAKQKVLFEGFTVFSKHELSKFIRIKKGFLTLCFENKKTTLNIEFLSNIAEQIVLTESAIKQIGL